MKRLIISAAVLALLAGPALAQRDNGGGHPEGGHAGHAGGVGGHAAMPQARPQRAPRPEVGKPAQPRVSRQPQAPRPAPNNPQIGRPGNNDNRPGNNDNRPGNNANRPGNNANRPGNNANRPGNNANRPGNSAGRPGGNNGNWNGNNRPGNGDRPGNNAGRPGYGGPRHDFSSFRNYHQNFQASRRFSAPSYRRPAGWYDHRWVFGEYLPTAFWARDYWLSDYVQYDLPPPPYGAVWVRVGDDALLVDQDSGEVITVEYGVFY